MKFNIIFSSCGFLIVVVIISIMLIFKPRNNIIYIITRIKTVKEEAETKNGFSNIVVVDSTSDTLCPAKYKHCSNIVATTDPEAATKLPDASATMYRDRSGLSTEFFAAPNASDLALRLSATLDLLEPFLRRLDKEHSKALESTHGRAWHLDTTKSRTLLRASDANYFQVSIPSILVPYLIIYSFHSNRHFCLHRWFGLTMKPM